VAPEWFAVSCQYKHCVLNSKMILWSLEADIAALNWTLHSIQNQWRSKALRGPGSTVIWGPSLSLPFTSPPSPFPPLPQPSPSPCYKAAPQIQLGGLGERCKLPQRGLGQSRSRNRILVHFSLKIRHLLATILMIFLRVLPKIFLWPHYSGAPGARGPRFIEPPEPPVPTPLFRIH